MTTIVLVRVDEEMVAAGPARVDLGERPKLLAVPVAKALVWLRRGTAEDVAKARAYAAAEGYKVVTYPRTEEDPLGRAKAEALAKVAPPGRTG